MALAKRRHPLIKSFYSAISVVVTLAIFFLSPSDLFGEPSVDKFPAYKALASSAPWKPIVEVKAILQLSTEIDSGIKNKWLYSESVTVTGSPYGIPDKIPLLVYFDDKRATRRVERNDEVEEGPLVATVFDFDSEGRLRFARETSEYYSWDETQVFLSEKGNPILVSRKSFDKVHNDSSVCYWVFDSAGNSIKRGDSGCGDIGLFDFYKQYGQKALKPSDYIAQEEQTIVKEKTRQLELEKQATETRVRQEELNKKALGFQIQNAKLKNKQGTAFWKNPTEEDHDIRKINRPLALPKSPIILVIVLPLLSLLFYSFISSGIPIKVKMNRYTIAYFAAWALYLTSFFLPVTKRYEEWKYVYPISGAEPQQRFIRGSDYTGFDLVKLVFNNKSSYLTYKEYASQFGAGEYNFLYFGLIFMFFTNGAFIFFPSIFHIQQKCFGFYKWVLVSAICVPFFGMVVFPELVGSLGIGFLAWITAWIFLVYSLKGRIIQGDIGCRAETKPNLTRLF